MKYTVILEHAEDNHLSLHCEVEGHYLPREGETMRIDARVWANIEKVHHEISTQYGFKVKKIEGGERATLDTETSKLEVTSIVQATVSAKDFDLLAETGLWFCHDNSLLDD